MSWSVICVPFHRGYDVQLHMFGLKQTLSLDITRNWHIFKEGNTFYLITLEQAPILLLTTLTKIEIKPLHSKIIKLLYYSVITESILRLSPGALNKLLGEDG